MARRTIGTATEALGWVKESNITEEKKELLINFINHFPTLTYHKKSRPETDPAWLKELGEVFLGDYSEELFWKYQYNHFDHSEYDDYRFQESFYSYQGFCPDLGDFQEITMEGSPLLIIVCLIENLRSILAVKADDSGDLNVYDFSYEDITRDKNTSGKGIIEPSQAQIAFPSYYEMLNRVSAIQFSDDTIVEAEE